MIWRPRTALFLQHRERADKRQKAHPCRDGLANSKTARYVVTMKLCDLLGNDAALDAATGAIAITGVAMDSRVVKAGDVFFALTGAKTDGARFVDQAVAAGAVAIVGDQAAQGAYRVPYIETKNARRELALAAARFYPR